MMNKVKQFNGWGIYELSRSEQKKYGFKVAVIHPEVMGIGLLTPADSDFELNSIEEAEDWIKNY